MVLFGLFFFILIIFAAVGIAFIKRIFLNDKPSSPSKLAKIVGPILMIISAVEWLSIICFPLILALPKLSTEDMEDILIALLVCFFSGICGFTLSFDYYQRYYKIPKYKQEKQDKSEPEDQMTNFVPRQFN